MPETSDLAATRATLQPRRGLALVATAAVLWALIGLFTPALLEEGLTAVDIGFWRALVGGLVFAVHAGVAGHGRVRERRDGWALLAFGVVAVGLFYVALAAAIESGGVSLAWILLYTAPAWVAVGATVILRERIDALRWTLVGATVVGVVLVSTGGGDGLRVSAISLAWGLTAGVTYASWYVAGKRLLDRYHPVTISLWTLLAGAAVLAPFVSGVPTSLRAWLLIAGIGVVSTYLPVLAYYSGLLQADASRAAIVATVEPVVALGIGVAVAGERLAPVALAGALVVLAAATVASMRR